MCRILRLFQVRDHTYIKIQTLHPKNRREIHGEFTEDRRIVSRLTNRFRGGCVSTDNDRDQEG